MTLHKEPKFNTPDLIAAMKAHGMKTDGPDILSDAFRLGWAANTPGWTPSRCEDCNCTYGGADCKHVRIVGN